uniref:Protein kinase domain-containing protein n=1 Tax=Ascaris lumbricoides TaxID=6252 RepID=A0A0M3IH34_ASCLU
MRRQRVNVYDVQHCQYVRNIPDNSITAKTQERTSFPLVAHDVRSHHHYVNIVIEVFSTGLTEKDKLGDITCCKYLDQNTGEFPLAAWLLNMALDRSITLLQIVELALLLTWLFMMVGYAGLLVPHFLTHNKASQTLFAPIFLLPKVHIFISL